MTRNERSKQRQRLLKKEYESGKEFLCCNICGVSYTIFRDGNRFNCGLTVDHIENVSSNPEKGNDDKNTQLVCWECNVSKKRHGGV